jgi:hypothetical protein
MHLNVAGMMHRAQPQPSKMTRDTCPYHHCLAPATNKVSTDPQADLQRWASQQRYKTPTPTLTVSGQHASLLQLNLITSLALQAA